MGPWQGLAVRKRAGDIGEQMLTGAGTCQCRCNPRCLLDRRHRLL